eukprot:scaffold26769_cov152-Cylindrotheca_fusiformis.AAC.2
MPLPHPPLGSPSHCSQIDWHRFSQNLAPDDLQHFCIHWVNHLLPLLKRQHKQVAAGAVFALSCTMRLRRGRRAPSQLPTP